LEPFRVQQAEGATHLVAETIEALRTAAELPAGASHAFH